MKHHNSPQKHEPTPPPAPKPSAETLQAGAKDFVEATDEIARRAYFTYVNQGSKPGHEVQHWLQAEAELIAERNRTRTHGFPRPT